MGQTLQPYAYAADDPSAGSAPMGRTAYPKSAVVAAKAAHKAHFGHLLIDIVAVAGAESTWNPKDHTGTGRQEVYGLWQINLYGAHHTTPTVHLCTYLHAGKRPNWQVPDLNARCARALSDFWTQAGVGPFQPWLGDGVVTDAHHVSRTASLPACQWRRTGGPVDCWKVAKAAVHAAGYNTRGMA